MSTDFNHTFVFSHDKKRSAAFLADVLGLPSPRAYRTMLIVQLANGVCLDFCDMEGDLPPLQHFAFMVNEAEFDQVFTRLRERGIPYFADPHHKQRTGEIYQHNGGRGVYFQGTDGQVYEVLTQPYTEDEFKITQYPKAP
jgi:catechol 2,3-dioxygenase-like lactoylglutathione lyase family enzyme